MGQQPIIARFKEKKLAVLCQEHHREERSRLKKQAGLYLEPRKPEIAGLGAIRKTRRVLRR